MQVIWTEQALSAWQETAMYILTNFGEQAQIEFYQNTLSLEKIITQMPQIGKVEPLLSHLPKLYRSIVVSYQNKLIYSIEDDDITIHDFWDTRREPKSLTNSFE